MHPIRQCGCQARLYHAVGHDCTWEGVTMASGAYERIYIRCIVNSIRLRSTAARKHSQPSDRYGCRDDYN